MKILNVLALFVSINSFAYVNDSLVKPAIRTSPLAMAQLKSPEKKYYLKATYGQPTKRNRIVFGATGIIPYNKIWRTGANEATEITFTQSVKINNAEIPAGSYTLFSIPDEKKWSIILNTELGQWGANEYDSTKNILKTDFSAQKNTEIYEGFTIDFKEIKNGANMNLMWDTVKVVVPITFFDIAVAEDKKKKKKK